MTLEIENIGKIRYANLDFKGITVIVGDNNSGKSTVGKTLAALFTVLPTLSDRVKRARRDYVFNDETVRYGYRFRQMSMDAFTQLYDDEHVTEEVVFNYLVEVWRSSGRWYGRRESGDGKLTEEVTKQIRQYASVAYERLIECRKIPFGKLADIEIEKGFSRYFYTNVKRFCCESAQLRLTVNQKTNCVTWGATVHGDIAEPLVKRGWFVGSPLVINAVSDEYLPCEDYERMHEPLLQRLNETGEANSVRKVIVGDKIRPIEDRLEEILCGRIFYSAEDDELMISGKGYAKPLPIKSLSMGLKAFAVLRWMLEKGVLQEKDVLVLDEPENHLHPRWQILYAEIIVMLQQCFDLTIFLTTHSPYFLESIQVFAKKYHMEDRLTAYQPEFDEDGLSSVIKNQITDNAELYRRFMEPLRELDILRAEQ